jgi:hypothetical protein
MVRDPERDGTEISIVVPDHPPVLTPRAAVVLRRILIDAMEASPARSTETMGDAA